MKVGIIAPYWLPHFGGAEQYVYRLCRSMLDKGTDVKVFTGTPYNEDKNCGNLEDVTTRWHPEGAIFCQVWGEYFDELETARGTIREDQLFQEYDFFSAAVVWAVENKLDTVLINNPLTRAMHTQARELYLQLKQHGIKVGAIHHDLGLSIRHDLIKEYKDGENFGDWDAAAETILEVWRENLSNRPKLLCYYNMDSPLFFEPDFVISNSEWSQRFIDPLEEVPKLVVHPLMDVEKFSQLVDQPQGLQPADVLMINPQFHKGRSIMANLILGGDSLWTYRVLKGGYGDAFKEFIPMVSNSRAAENEQIDFQEYVYDITEAYRQAGVAFVPSRYEGYGMAAVEPMFCGTAVVCSSYPSILEAVGGGAKTVCPFIADSEEWYDAVDDVLLQPDLWISKGFERVKELTKRQEHEVWELIYFLEALI